MAQVLTWALARLWLVNQKDTISKAFAISTGNSEVMAQIYLPMWVWHRKVGRYRCLRTTVQVQAACLLSGTGDKPSWRK